MTATDTFFEPPSLVRAGVWVNGGSVVRAPRPPRDLGVKIERLSVFIIPLASFITAGALLALRYHSILGDEISREANAYYVFFSNDPHLAAIGFVWNPLTSISEMPLILLKGIWPALTTYAFAANIMSAIFMAGACYQILRFMQDLAVARAARIALVACFVLNPMIFYYGANGMSEALFIFTLVATARRLALWLAQARTKDLIVAGIWLGLAYAARNEAAMSAAFACVVVLGVSYHRTQGSKEARRRTAAADTVLFGAPFALSFLGWAAVSYIIVGHAFEQFQSQYGNSSQIAVQGPSAYSHGYLLGWAISAIVSLAPLLPVAVVWAGVRSWRARDPRILAVLAVLGGVESFEVGGFTVNLLVHQYRFFIYAIPMMVMLCAFVAAPVRKSPYEEREERIQEIEGWTPRFLPARRRQRRILSTLGATAAIAMVIPGSFTSWHEMFHAPLGSLESSQLSWIVYPHTKTGDETAQWRGQFPAIEAEAAELDALKSGKGSIMVDDFEPCIPQVILASKDPAEFAIPNDVDFTQKFGAPYQDGIRYILVSDPGSAFGSLDSINREYTSLYYQGSYNSGSTAVLLNQITLPTCQTFRLYRLKPEGS